MTASPRNASSPRQRPAMAAVRVLDEVVGRSADCIGRRKLGTLDHTSPNMDFNLQQGIAVLERTSATLRAMLLGLPREWTEANEGPNTWSAYDIVGHLVHGERTDWITRAKIILAQGVDTRFTPYDRFAQFRESEGKSLPQLLDEFARLRTENLTQLAGWRLTDAQLALEGVHPEFGAVTLRQLFSTWVAHDLGHIAQIARVMAKQYRDAIGPWRAYLPIMER